MIHSNVGNPIKNSDKKAVIWHLGHCGFAVETKNYFLIFDYVPWKPVPDKLELKKGFLNPLKLKKKVRVFVSHSHSNHYNKVIYSWEKNISDIKYFFGWKAGNSEKHNYLKAPRGSYKDKELEVYTINSHHSGVPESAFLVKVDNLVIFHGGDYKADYKNDFPYLKTKVDHIDFAIVNSVYDEGHHFTLQLIDLINIFKPKALYPQHALNDYNDYKKFSDYYKSKGFNVRILCPEKRGDKFIYKNGTTKRDQN